MSEARPHPSPFPRREPIRPSLLQRLRGRTPPINAFIELSNTLAEHPISDLPGPEVVDEIEARHRVDLNEAFPARMEELYRTFLLHCFEDRCLSETEREAADRLARLLRLPEDRCRVIQRQVVRRLYLRSIEHVLADGTVDRRERAFLQWLQSRLEIPPDVAGNLLELRGRQRGVDVDPQQEEG